MAEFLQACLVFPTVIFSLLLSLTLLYWLSVCLGALDIDLFDIDTDLGGADPEFDVDTDTDTHGLFADLLARLDLTEIPLTVSLSLFSLLGWLISFVAVDLLGGVATTLVLGAALWVGASAISLLLTSRVAQLLKPAFRTHYAPSNRGFVGKVCEITTLKVDERYGQAQLDDGGAGLLIQVRSSDAAQLTRGSSALIFDYDTEQQIFHVKPLEATEPSRTIESDALPETT